MCGWGLRRGGSRLPGELACPLWVKFDHFQAVSGLGRPFGPRHSSGRIKPLGDRVADTATRVKRGSGVLEDILDSARTTAMAHIDTVDENLTAGSWGDPDHRPCQCRLARAGLSDQTDNAARGNSGGVKALAAPRT